MPVGKFWSILTELNFDRTLTCFGYEQGFLYTPLHPNTP